MLDATGDKDKDRDYVDAPAEAPAPKKKRAPAKPKASAAAAAALVGHCSLSKKDFGDRIKSCLKLEKYEIQPMHFRMTMDAPFFRAFFGTNGIVIAPSTFDETTEIVVATLTNAQAGAVFGVSKIKNGNRYQSYDLAKMVVIFYPKTSQAEAWLTV
ncbi:hypothetical protein FIBSPDRAFT_893318 [Athelia psychrophila]|uniref:Uncharacterized protein n=1 Tax=Athelia psychrophila TaxID=1759441 RepID=A0A166HD53_9AGAM|nr:hypothetical protein FIBSPDRAFT_893318 [Fibularhizoctonia sp. CBS 109695]